VSLLGLQQANDEQICAYAARHGFVVCSKDANFQRLVAARGYRPRLIQLAMGNVSNDPVLAALLASADRLLLAFDDPATGVVVIESGRVGAGASCGCAGASAGDGRDPHFWLLTPTSACLPPVNRLQTAVVCIFVPLSPASKNFTAQRIGKRSM
jgi:predicted nuclease of predicted toxin-antitoxin system